jgi:hypothetical protein
MRHRQCAEGLGKAGDSLFTDQDAAPAAIPYLLVRMRETRGAMLRRNAIEEPRPAYARGSIISVCAGAPRCDQ